MQQLVVSGFSFVRRIHKPPKIDVRAGGEEGEPGERYASVILKSARDWRL